MAAKDVSMRPQLAQTAPQSQAHEQKVQTPTPSVKAVTRPQSLTPAESFEESFSEFRRHQQLWLLERIAVLSTPDCFEEDVMPQEALVLRDIEAIQAELLAQTGTHLRTQQLLDHGLASVSADRLPKRYWKPLWSEAEKKTFATMRNKPLAQQRGELSAIWTHERSQLSTQLPEVAIDALFCIEFDRKPRTLHAEKLKRLYKECREQVALRCARQKQSMLNRLVATGMETILKPAIAAMYPDPAKQESVLASISGIEGQHGVILKLCNEERKFQRQGKKLKDGLAEAIDEVERLQEAIDQCEADMQETELYALDVQLRTMLLNSISFATKEQWNALLIESASPEAMEAFVYTPPSNLEPLLETLKSDDERLQALRIVWGEAPIFCLGFARKLSELLRFAGDQADQLLDEIEAHLVIQLGAVKLGENRGQAQAQRIINQVEQILRPPAHVAAPIAAQPAQEAQPLESAAPAPTRTAATNSSAKRELRTLKRAQLWSTRAGTYTRVTSTGKATPKTIAEPTPAPAPAPAVRKQSKPASEHPRNKVRRSISHKT